MRFAALTLLAAALGVACAVLVACGANDDHLIPGSDASALKRYADRASQDVAAEDCQRVNGDIAAAQKRIGSLPSSVDPGLRQNLVAGFDNLARQAANKCQGTTDTTTTDTTPTETTQTTDTTPTDTTQTTDTTPTTQTTDTTSTETTQTTDTTPGNGNGNGNGNGDSGGSPSGGDQGGTGGSGARRGRGREATG